MSRLLVIGINYAPEYVSTGKYTSEMCEWLVAAGHDVRVVTAPPYYPAWNIRPEYRGRGYHREWLNGVEVLRCPIWVPRVPRGLTRLLHLSSFGLTSIGALLYSWKWKPDWVINVAPTLASAPGALGLARVSGAKCWLHIQDFELDAALDMGIVNAGRLRRLVLKCERFFIGRFDVVSTIAPRMIMRLKNKGVPDDRVVHFPNWADIDGIAPLPGISRYRADLGIPADAVVALYSGNMGLKQGLELLAQAASLLRDEHNIYFVFGGEGPARSELEKSCAGLANVRFTGFQPTERLTDWLGLADVHLLPQRADVADLVMPSKLTGMLASGRPVLATAKLGTGVAETVEGRGVVTPPEDIVAFVSALRSLAGDPDQRKRLGRAARKHAEATLSRNSVLRQFQSDLDRRLA